MNVKYIGDPVNLPHAPIIISKTPICLKCSGIRGLFCPKVRDREIMKREKISAKDMFWKAKLPLKIKIFLWYLRGGGG